MEPDKDLDEEIASHPALPAIIVVTGALDQLFKWVFDFSRLTFLFMFVACSMTGMIFYYVANSPMATEDPESTAAAIRYYWVMIYGDGETVGWWGLRGNLLVLTGFLFLLPLWILVRLFLFPFYVAYKLIRLRLRSPVQDGPSADNVMQTRK